MKREEFLKQVVEMCGPAETEAVGQLAKLPPDRRRSAAREQGDAAADDGLTDFLLSLIEDDLIDDLATILPGGSSQDEAEELLKRLWARLLLLVTPQAKDILYAHNQLRLMAEQRARRGPSSSAPTVDRAYRTAVDNARAVLSATDNLEGQKKPTEQLDASETTE